MCTCQQDFYCLMIIVCIIYSCQFFERSLVSFFCPAYFKGLCKQRSIYQMHLLSKDIKSILMFKIIFLDIAIFMQLVVPIDLIFTIGVALYMVLFYVFMDTNSIDPIMLSFVFMYGIFS